MSLGRSPLLQYSNQAFVLFRFSLRTKARASVNESIDDAFFFAEEEEEEEEDEEEEEEEEDEEEEEEEEVFFFPFHHPRKSGMLTHPSSRYLGRGGYEEGKGSGRGGDEELRGGGDDPG